MLDFIDSFLGFSLIDTFGEYIACAVVILFVVISVEFFVQVFMVFWRWLFHAK